MGDKPGHEFRGNQHTDSKGNDSDDNARRKDEATPLRESTPEEAKQTRDLKAFADLDSGRPYGKVVDKALLAASLKAKEKSGAAWKAYKKADEAGDSAGRSAAWKEYRKHALESGDLLTRATMTPEQIRSAKEGITDSFRRLEAGEGKSPKIVDLDHLAKENKIPAKVADVPTGGKGAYEYTESPENKARATRGLPPINPGRRGSPNPIVAREKLDRENARLDREAKARNLVPRRRGK